MLINFHKGGSSNFKNRLIQRIIKFWTRSQYCHIELQFNYGENSFSARGQDNYVGWKKINYSHHERWYTLHINLSKAHENEIYQRIQAIDKSKYDYLVPFRKKTLHNGRFYCFEAVAHVLGIEPCNLYGDQLLEKIKEKFLW